MTGVQTCALPILEHSADMVVGDRLSSTYFQENKRPFHNWGNSIVRKSVNKLFKTDIKDIMTGYRALSYEFVKTFPVVSRGFEIETEMSIHAVDKHMQIENFVVDYRDRPEGSKSKLNTYSDGIKVLLSIFRLFRNYKPLGFFGGVSAILILIAIVFFIPVFTAYINTGMVEKFPTLIVCGFVVIAAIQSFFSGLILSNIVEKDKRDFENQLKKAYDEKKLKRINANIN